MKVLVERLRAKENDVGLNSWDDYQRLIKMAFYPRKYLLAPGVSGADVNRLHTRVRLAKRFQGISVEGYSPKTILGYDGLFQAFLTHSALETFIKFRGPVKDDKLDALSTLMTQYGGREVLQGCFQKDKNGTLYNFLHKRVNHRLKDRLRRCRSEETDNVGYLSACIRHIFAHGELSANADNVNPMHLHSLCLSVSDFLLDLIDTEFTKKVDACYERIRAEEAKSDDNANGGSRE
jgi:hypothetical protein